jgi:hypothetical protein
MEAGAPVLENVTPAARRSFNRAERGGTSAM